jgi:hypothetical protein
VQTNLRFLLFKCYYSEHMRPEKAETRRQRHSANRRDSVTVRRGICSEQEHARAADVRCHAAHLSDCFIGGSLSPRGSLDRSGGNRDGLRPQRGCGCGGPFGQELRHPRREAQLRGRRHAVLPDDGLQHGLAEKLVVDRHAAGNRHRRVPGEGDLDGADRSRTAA